jgi:Transglutaminase-like superfamily
VRVIPEPLAPALALKAPPRGAVPAPLPQLRIAERGDGITESRLDRDAHSGIIPSMPSADLTFWRSQSPVTQPGAAADLLDALPADPDALTEISSQMVFHYRADGDWEANGISADRAAEINLCYAADMFGRLLELEPSLQAARSPAQRILGCCRDFSTLYVSILRHHRIPSRCRVGFASYFDADWWIDHVVVEVWHGGRWRMIDPELRVGFSAGDGGPLDRLDLRPDRFLTAAQAWLAARAGRIDPSRVVVAPMLEVPQTRGWPQLAHDLVHDIAALNGIELLLWQDWGASLVEDVLASDVVHVLDQSAKSAADPEVSLAVVQRWGAHELLRVPETVSQIDPMSVEFNRVDVSRALTTA